MILSISAIERLNDGFEWADFHALNTVHWVSVSNNSMDWELLVCESLGLVAVLLQTNAYRLHSQ